MNPNKDFVLQNVVEAKILKKQVQKIMEKSVIFFSPNAMHFYVDSIKMKIYFVKMKV